MCMRSSASTQGRTLLGALTTTLYEAIILYSCQQATTFILNIEMIKRCSIA
jgi:hypothetical protein